MDVQVGLGGIHPEGLANLPAFTTEAKHIQVSLHCFSKRVKSFFLMVEGGGFQQEIEGFLKSK